MGRLRAANLAISPSTAWVAVAVLSIVVGIQYVATAPLIFEPGGWFALDGRRVLDAANAWRVGTDPYAVHGFVYSPVAVVLAAPLTFVPGAVAVLGWISATIVVAGALVWGALRNVRASLRVLAIPAVLLFVPVMTDVVLANVTVMLVAAAWIAVRGDRARSGVALGVLAVAFPKPLLLPILLWMVVWRRRAGAGAIAGGTVAILATLAIAGPGAWEQFVGTLRSGGGIDLTFVGNFGLSKLAPPLAIPAGLLALVVFGWLLIRRDADHGLVGATAIGPYVAPYAGIYAAVPLLLVLPWLARTRPWPAVLLAAIAILAAPSALLVAALALVTVLVSPDRRRSDATAPGPAMADPAG